MAVNKKIGLVLSGGGARGSYEVGVLRYLQEKGISPGVVAGTSVGAINGVAIASGMTRQQIEDLWLTIRTRHVFRYSIWQSIKGLFQPLMTPFFDTAPLYKLLHKYINISKVRNSPIKIFVTAVDINTGEVDVFSNNEIELEHIVASASIPVVFPWTVIQGKHYWDGGIAANTPIMPVLAEGAKDIYAILLAPYGSQTNYGLPANKLQAIERLLDFTLMGSFEIVFNSLSPEQVSDSKYKIKKRGLGSSNFYIIEPKESLGLHSILNFSKKQAKVLLQRGYEDARQDLKNHLGS